VSVIARLYPETEAGGFSRKAGGLLFYARVQELLEPGMTVLDFGAGRGLHAESRIKLMRELANMKGKVAKVIGVDVDDAVMRNPMLDEAHVFDGRRIPLADRSVDLVVSDHVFEHIEDPAAAAAELDRILKPGGWICARTPSSGSLIALGARLVPNRLHAKLLRRIQPDGTREDEDVFPTRYRLNSKSALRRYFPPARWEHYSHYWDGEPAYHFGSVAVARLMQLIMALKPGGEKLFVFLRKK
jgi:SAM-dependent methyltransferase